jgi:hypothetical protein
MRVVLPPPVAGCRGQDFTHTQGPPRLGGETVPRHSHIWLKGTTCFGYEAAVVTAQ